MMAKHLTVYGLVVLFVALCELPAFVFDTLFGKSDTDGNESSEK